MQLVRYGVEQKELMMVRIRKRRKRERKSWSGESGKGYRYDLYDLDDKFPRQSGIFIYVKGTGRKQEVIYIGYAENLKRELESHDTEHRLSVYAGATHVFIHRLRRWHDWESELDDLVSHLKPLGNDRDSLLNGLYE